MPRDRSADRAAIAIAAVVALVTYAFAVRLGFAYDDEPMLVQNRLIHSLSELPAALSRPYWLQYGTLYRPLTTLSFGLDWAIGGGSAWPFHLGNVFFHALTSALVVLLALRWLPPMAACLAGVFFAVHPVHVEAVCNAVGRAELMCGAAMLGVALMASRPTSKPRDQWLAVALLSAAALGSKETGVTAPVVAAMAAWVATRDRARAMALGGAALAGIAPLLVARVLILGTLGGDQPHMAFQATTYGGGLLLALATLPRTIGLMLVPQLPHYEYSPSLAQLLAADRGMALLGVALVIAGLAAVVALVRRPSWPAFALVMTSATLLPVSNLVFRAGIVLAERTLYTPSIGIVLLLASAFALVPATGMARKAVLTAVGVLLGVSAAISARDVPVWDRTSTAVHAFITRSPESYAGWMFQGNVYVLRSQRDSAIMAYERGLSLFDRDHRLVHAAATQELLAGDTARAVHWFDHALARWPASRRSRTVLIHVKVAQHRGDEALALLEKGLELEPDQHGWERLRDSLRAARVSTAGAPATPPGRPAGAR
jgi:tetratricopeptide (TPR) repeat protein